MTMQRHPLALDLPLERIRALAAPPKPVKATATPSAPKRRGSSLPMFQPRIPQDVVDAIRRERDAGARVIDLAAKYNVTAAYVSLVTHNMRRASRMEGGAV